MSTRGLAGLAMAMIAGSALAQPANNNCANAIAIGPGTVNGTTVASTRDGTANCGASASSPDVWYLVTNTTGQSRNLVVDTCGSSWDTVLSLHTACPTVAGNQQLACNDDSCGLQSRVSTTIANNQTVYIRVAGYNNATGPFTLTVGYEEPPPPPTRGPDVIVGEMIDVAYYASSNGVSSYAIGTDSCNIGDVPVEWQASNNQHPVIAQAFYRIMNNRLEMIGQSWLKHGFASVNGSTCATCVQPPGGGSQLGVNCSDPYGSGLNGSQGNLGPRWQVNATTGVYPYPYSAPGWSGDIMRRINVAQSDIITGAGAPVYLAETHYVTSDDAQWNNGRNNMSYRRITFPGTTGTPNFVGATRRTKSAIEGWAEIDPTVVLAPTEYVDTTIPGRPINARFWVASKVVDNGNGTWTYNYAVLNLNADRDGASFSLPLGGRLTATSPSFRDVASHSGDPKDNTDWASTTSNSAQTWACTQTYQQNPNANSLRWGTTFSFSVTTTTARIGRATIDLFKPGTPAALKAMVQVPGFGPCRADLNRDGQVDFNDYLEFLNLMSADNDAVDFNEDGAVDFNDYLDLLNRLNSGGC